MEIFVKFGTAPVQKVEADREPKISEQLRIRALIAFDRGRQWYDVRCYGVTDDLGNDIYLLDR